MSTGIFIINLKEPQLNQELKTTALETLGQGTRKISNRGGLQSENIPLNRPVISTFF